MRQRNNTSMGSLASVVILLVLAALVAVPATAQLRRPNFVFILGDDLRWDALGCAGHPFARTPNVDRLAREGARFKNAFVTTPLCSPSRAGFLTGQYVRTNGIRGNGNQYSARSHELVTFPRLLRNDGYETAYVGKWHMGNDSSPRPGFDRWVSFRGQGAYLDPTLNLDGKEEQVRGYMTDLLSARAAEWVRRPRTKPFCLYLAHKASHGPFTPAERHAGLFADQPVVRGPGARDTLEGKPVLRRQVGNLRPVTPGMGPGDQLVRNQLRCLAAIDEGVGEVRKALEETGVLEDTVVVFTSDNGYFWGEHGLGDKRAAYEESIRIPLLVRFPRLVKASSAPEGLALNIDIAPTFLELAGAPVPKEMHGRSLVPLLRGGAGGWRKSALFEYFVEPNYPRIPTWQAVRTERWKYLRYPELEGMDELYDLRDDPQELKNRIGDQTAADTLAELRDELRRQLHSSGEENSRAGKNGTADERR